MRKADYFIDPMVWNTTGYGFLDKTADGVYHPGVDLNWNWGDQDLGRAIFVCAHGLVEAVRYDRAWGNHIFVKHELTDWIKNSLNDLKVVYSHYAHLDKMLVNPGDELSAKTQIGTCGKSGSSHWGLPVNQRFAHLHYEIRKPIGKGYTFWPRGWSAQKVQEYYFDPIEFARDFSPKESEEAEFESKWRIVEQFRKELSRHIFGNTEAEWEKIYDEITREGDGILSQLDNLRKMEALAFRLWTKLNEEMRTSYPYPPTGAGEKELLTALHELIVSKKIGEDEKLIKKTEYERLKARRSVDRYTTVELIKIILDRIFKKWS